jgi:SAM-dependent methyltransferase
VTAAFFRTLARDAARRYPARDRYARTFAYGKLTGDPAFRHLLQQGVIPARASLLDLGCGIGVLPALLLAARERHAAGDWPAGWPAPPQPQALRGIDYMPKDVRRAQAALGSAGSVVQGDIRHADFGRADVVVMLDVLHYIDFAAQQAVLERARDTLAADGGLLLLRVADATPTLRFRITVAVDRAMSRLRGYPIERLYCRTLAEWQQLLARLGFEVAATPMSEGTPFANTLLAARYHRR